MRKHLSLALLLLAGFAGSGWAQTYYTNPASTTPGVGTVTSITAGQGVDLDGTCGSGTTTTTGTLTACMNTNAQSGTTYTVLASDCGKLVSLSNASAVAVTLPEAGTTGFEAGCKISFTNEGAGTATVTPTTSTIGGKASQAIQQNGGFMAVSDGTNWRTAGIAVAADASGVIDQTQIPTATVTVKGGVKPGACLSMSGTTMNIDSDCREKAIVFMIDGGGAAITTGVKGYLSVPFACSITNVTLLADVSGSIVVDIWKDTYANYPPTDADSITASAVPTISSATKSTDSTLTGWTTSLAAGDILGFNVDSASTITLLTIALTCLMS